MDRQNNFPVFVAIVDDEPDLASLFKDALDQIPEIVAFAFTNPSLALEHFRANRERYGCVISDYRMPRITGVQLLTKVKEIKPEVTTILISAFDMENEDFNSVDKFLQKPIMINDLLEQIRNVIIKAWPKINEIN